MLQSSAWFPSSSPRFPSPCSPRTTHTPHLSPAATAHFLLVARKHRSERIHENKQTNKQTDRQTRQTRQTDRQGGKRKTDESGGGGGVGGRGRARAWKARKTALSPALSERRRRRRGGGGSGGGSGQESKPLVNLAHGLRRDAQRVVPALRRESDGKGRKNKGQRTGGRGKKEGGARQRTSTQVSPEGSSSRVRSEGESINSRSRR